MWGTVCGRAAPTPLPKVLGSGLHPRCSVIRCRTSSRTLTTSVKGSSTPLDTGHRASHSDTCTASCGAHRACQGADAIQGGGRARCRPGTLHVDVIRQYPGQQQVDRTVDVPGRHFPQLEAAEQKQFYSGSCLLYTSPSPRDMRRSRMPSSA